MTWMVLFSSLFIFSIVLGALMPFGLRSDKQKNRLIKIEGKISEEIDEEFDVPFVQRFLVPIFYGILRTISNLFPKTNKVNSVVRLEKELKLAGIKLTANEFYAVRLIIMIVCIVLGIIPLIIPAVPPLVKMLSFVIGAILAILVPRYYLKAKIKTRQNGIRLQMPDILDLLSVSVEAGLGFDAALIRVSDRTTGPLVDELVTVYHEMQLGRPRKEALKDLGERSNVDELQMFASSLIQADQLGISLKNVLRAQSQQLRLSRKQRAEEKSMKAPVKMMIPLVVFIFPVIFIILLGPSAMEIMTSLK